MVSQLVVPIDNISVPLASSMLICDDIRKHYIIRIYRETTASTKEYIIRTNRCYLINLIVVTSSFPFVCFFV